MISSAVFMNRLRRIIADAPCDDATSLAVNMFRCFKRSLYSNFDIRTANRLTRTVKAQVSDVLADLRLEVMHIEFAAPEQSPVRAACSAVRWEIDMARRALSLRNEIPEGDPPEDAAPVDAPGEEALGESQQDGQQRAMLEACHRELEGAIGVVVSFPSPGPNRRRILQSMEALSRSRALLARLRRLHVR